MISVCGSLLSPYVRVEGTDRMSLLLMQHACLLTSSEEVRKRSKTWGKLKIFERDEKWERSGKSGLEKR